MNEIFNSILIMSFTGGMLTLLLLCIKPLTKKYFSPRWQYYIWLSVLAVMIMPITVSLPANSTAPTEYEPVHTVYTQPNTVTVTEEAVPNIQASPSQAMTIRRRLPNGFSTLWVVGALLMLTYKVSRYIIFSAAVSKSSEISSKSTSSALCVHETDMIDSPMLVGLIKPVLYLPKSDITESEFSFILRHEFVHYRRCDILYKWLTMAVTCIHWFNPLVYAAAHEIDTECEISCDYEVCRGCTSAQKEVYMAVILNMAQKSLHRKRPLTTQMADGKKALRRRFEMIKNKKSAGKVIGIASVIFAAVIFCAAALQSGIISGMTSDNGNIEVTLNGKKTTFENEPFIQNNTVYLPLEEMLKAEGIGNITQKGEYIQFTISAHPYTEYRGIKYDHWINRICVGRKYAYIMGHSEGSTENAEILCEPIMKDGTVYAPFDLFIKLRGQGVFEDFAVGEKHNPFKSKSEHAAANTPHLMGELYLSEELNFMISIPLDLTGRYTAEETVNAPALSDTGSGYAVFSDTGTDEVMFYIIQGSPEKSDINISDLDIHQIYENGNDTYSIGIPKTGNYSEYIEDIEKSFNVILKYTPLPQ